MIQEEQSCKQLALDDLELLLTHVISGSSIDNPFRQQLERDIDNLKKRWQQLATALKSKQEDFADAVKLVKQHEELKAKIENWMMETNIKLQKISSPPSNPRAAEEEYSRIKVSRCNIIMIVTMCSLSSGN